jgi:hypothetical protein
LNSAHLRLKKAKPDRIASFAKAANVKRPGTSRRLSFQEKMPSTKKARRLLPAG